MIFKNNVPNRCISYLSSFNDEISWKSNLHILIHKKKVYPDSNIQFTIMRKSWFQESEATDYVAFTSRRQKMVNAGACSNFSFLFSPGSQAME